MCRHFLSFLAGGSFPVARYSAGAINDKRQVRRCFPLSLAFWSCPNRPVLSPPDERWALLADPLEATGDREPCWCWAIRMGQFASRAMGDCGLRMPPEGGHAKLHRQESAACSIGNDQDVATAGYDAPFPGLSRQDWTV